MVGLVRQYVTRIGGHLSWADRVSLSSATVLLFAALVVPPLWRNSNPNVHARWWYAYGGTSESGSVLGLDHWIEVDVGVESPTGSVLWADTRCVGAIPPVSDPWGHAWRHTPAPTLFVGRSPGMRVVVDANGNWSGVRDPTGLLWSSGPDGLWNWGRGDDILLDGPVYDVWFLAASRLLLAAVGLTVIGAVVVAHYPGPQSRCIEPILLAAAAAILWTPVGIVLQSNLAIGPSPQLDFPWAVSWIPRSILVHCSGSIATLTIVALMRAQGIGPARDGVSCAELMPCRGGPRRSE